MASKENNFTGIASGTAITAPSQTGGASGDQFDTVDLDGTGVSVTVDTAADLTAAFDRGIICDLNGQTQSTAALSWNLAAAVSTSYHRMYYRTPTTTPNTTLRIAVGLKGTTRVWELRHSTGNRIALTDWTSGSTIIQTNALDVDTVYRIEWKVAQTDVDSELLVYAGEETTGASPQSRFGFGISGANLDWDVIRMGATVNATAYTGSAPQMAALGYSDTALLGPAQAASGPAFTVWDGASEVAPTSVKVWDGAAEVDYSSATIN